MEIYQKYFQSTFEGLLDYFDTYPDNFFTIIKRVLAKLHLFSHLNLLFIFANTWVIQLR